MISRRAVRKMIGERSSHGLLAQLLVHREPVHVGHHDVEEHEVGEVESRRAHGLAAVGGGLHVVPGHLERLGDEPADVGLVVDDEDSLGHLFTLLPAGSGAASDRRSTGGRRRPEPASSGPASAPRLRDSGIPADSLRPAFPVSATARRTLGRPPPAGSRRQARRGRTRSADEAVAERDQQHARPRRPPRRRWRCRRSAACAARASPGPPGRSRRPGDPRRRRSGSPSSRGPSYTVTGAAEAGVRCGRRRAGAAAAKHGAGRRQA